MPSNGLVSVVIPTRNRRQRLARAIASVRAQTWPRLEIIVIDDASTDDTAEYLRSLAAERPDLCVVRNDVPRGGGAARNQGIAAARGDYVAFLDDDDVWLPEKTQVQIAILESQPAAAVSCSFFVDHEAGGRTLTTLRPPADRQALLHTNRQGGASMCVARRELLLAVGGFDERLRSCQDWDLWLKLHAHGPIVVCPQPLVSYIPHDGQRITSNLRATYSGRRRLYFRYKSQMTSATRQHHLAELLYCRTMICRQGSLARLREFVRLSRIVGPSRSLRYAYRAIRQGLAGMARR